MCARKHSTLSSKWTVDTCNNKAHQAFQLVSRSQILAADEPTTGYRKCIYTGQLTKMYSPATLWPNAIQYGGVLANKTRTVYSHTICNTRGVQTSSGQHKMHTTSILPDDNQYWRLLTTVNMEDVPTTVKTECVFTDELRSVNTKSVPTNKSGVFTNNGQHGRCTYERQSTLKVYLRTTFDTGSIPANHIQHGNCTHVQHGQQ